MDRVTCTSCRPDATSPALPCTSPQAHPLFLHWYRGTLFVLRGDGKVVGPAGGQTGEENQYFRTQRWEPKKREGVGAQEQGLLQNSSASPSAYVSQEKTRMALLVGTRTLGVVCNFFPSIYPRGSQDFLLLG